MNGHWTMLGNTEPIIIENETIINYAF